MTTTLIRWNPIREATSLRQAMDRLFDEAFIGPALWSRADGAGLTYRLPVDAYSTANEIVVQAALPGVDPKEVQITLEGDTLSIAGELPARLEDADYLIAERAAGRFNRTLTLNVPVDVDKAEAHFENGLLTLTLPKAEAARPKQITVKTK